MTSLRILCSRVLALFDGKRLDARLDDEVRAHVGLLAAEYERQGLPPEEARLAARRAFGGVEPMKDAYRDRRGVPWLSDLGRDVQYARRTLIRNPGFAAVAVITLALGIGANTALFSLIDSLILRKLPVPQPDELVVFAVGDGQSSDVSFSYPLYEEFRDNADHLTGVVASMGATRRQAGMSPGADAELESVSAEGVTGNFFQVLGVPAAVGRTISADDDRRGSPQAVVVLSHGFWSRRFGSDPAVIGRTITVTDVPFTIVGVAARGFSGVEIGEHPDLWFPLQMLARFDPTATSFGLFDQRTSEWLLVMGRLRPGATHAAAQARMEPLHRRDLQDALQRLSSRPGPAMTESQRQAFLRQRLELRPGATGVTDLRQQYGRALVILMSVVGVVLLVGCANLANLLLARGASRQKEIAVRMAIGAGRRRVVRQLLAESVFLAAVGGALALAVAAAVIRVLLSFVPDPDTAFRAGLDLRVLAFAAAVSVLTGLLFGVVPAVSITRRSLPSALVEQGRTTASRRRLTLHNTLVVSQIALAVVVLITGGLFLRSLQNLQRLELGFDENRLTVFRLNVPGAYDPARRGEVFGRVVDRLNEMPEAVAVSFSMFGLLSGTNRTIQVDVPGYTPTTPENTRVQSALVGPDFFDVTGMRVVRGRGFDSRDDRSAGRVAIVDREMAQRFFGDDPLGHRFTSRSGESFEVVGVVADARYRALKETPTPTFYVPFAQESADAPSAPVQVAIRTRTDAPASARSVERAVRDVDPVAVVSRVRSMGQVIDASIAQERLLAMLAALFGILAFTLASVGVYGVRSFAVSGRTNEIGIRMALGATSRSVLRGVLGQGLALAVAGIALGSAVAVAVTRYVGTLLYEVTPRDPVTYLAAAGLFAIVAAIASYVPARRAARVDPLAALRSE